MAREVQGAVLGTVQNCFQMAVHVPNEDRVLVVCGANDVFARREVRMSPGEVVDFLLQLSGWRAFPGKYTIQLIHADEAVVRLEEERCAVPAEHDGLDRRRARHRQRDQQFAALRCHDVHDAFVCADEHSAALLVKARGLREERGVTSLRASPAPRGSLSLRRALLREQWQPVLRLPHLQERRARGARLGRAHEAHPLLARVHRRVGHLTAEVDRDERLGREHIPLDQQPVVRAGEQPAAAARPRDGSDARGVPPQRSRDAVGVEVAHGDEALLAAAREKVAASVKLADDDHAVVDGDAVLDDLWLLIV
mmetsp:Transcript_22134/g.50711  ORF Transcript_22134/g.50711 Transcript_22134/m.50711 type:complete len:309 (-) Transcript_22134:86-1012(-)